MKEEIQHLTLRDHLALDRTVLANRRTSLSFLRTTAMLFGGGTTFIKTFSSDTIMILLGGVFIFLSCFGLYFGFRNFLENKKIFKKLRTRGIYKG